MPKLGERSRRKTAVPIDALASNVGETAATAMTVLAHFRLALERSGMAEGLGAYRAMTETLINQRLWALRNDPKSGDERVKGIAAEARAIHALLTPYADLMAKLALLPQLAIDDPPAAHAPSETSRDRVLAWLKRQPAPVSATRIRSALGISSLALEAALRRLEEAGEVEGTGAGGRRLFVARPGS